MFFRRARLKELTFEDRLAAAREAGFMVTPQAAGRVRVSRGGCAAVLENAGGEARVVERAGLFLGDEIAPLVDGGFQKFFQAPGGRRQPALAPELQAIHQFEEDLREALGLTSLYNQSLGTVSAYYLYDRLKDRDRGAPKRVWER